jgi:predicted RNA-binding protein associated with RNAse of E/G family
MSAITVRKLNPAGQETWRYTGRLLERQADYVVLEAAFNHTDIPLHGIVLQRGDRFVETFYTDRWYNIFEIHDRDDDRLKGWYCNIGRPAVINDSTVAYVDLALDLLVYPDGKQLVLDEDEYQALALPPEIQQQARQALDELHASFTARFAR